MDTRTPPPKVLTIAGSDSGGAAGLQADMRTFAALGVYRMCAVTAVTAQNSVSVNGVEFMSGKFVQAQMDAVLSDYGTHAVKTGFLGRAEIIESVTTSLHLFQPANIVIDPVLVNHKGQAMFAADVLDAYSALLLPLANLVTPNRREAELLTGLPVQTMAEMETAVQHIHALGPQNVLLKGGRAGDDIIDVLYDGDKLTRFRSPFVDTDNTHGSGDTLSAAVAAYLARGLAMETAVAQAHQFTAQAIQRAATWQMGQGHGPLWPLPI